MKVLPNKHEMCFYLPEGAWEVIINPIKYVLTKCNKGKTKQLYEQDFKLRFFNIIDCLNHQFKRYPDGNNARNTNSL